LHRVGLLGDGIFLFQTETYAQSICDTVGSIAIWQDMLFRAVTGGGVLSLVFHLEFVEAWLDLFGYYAIPLFAYRLCCRERRLSFICIPSYGSYSFLVCGVELHSTIPSRTILPTETIFFIRLRIVHSLRFLGCGLPPSPQS
jgi:hypothetical protein